MLIKKYKDMGLIKCPDCGGKVSDSVPMCIHCGRPLYVEEFDDLKNTTSFKEECEKIIEETCKKNDHLKNDSSIPLFGYFWLN